MYTMKRKCSEEEKNIKRYDGVGYHSRGFAKESSKKMEDLKNNPVTEGYHVKGFNDVAGSKNQ